jgi:hypothetical protein
MPKVTCVLLQRINTPICRFLQLRARGNRDKLPVSQGFDSILTITNQGCTKAAIFIPCNKDITAEEIAALYIKHVFTHFGLPTKVISN